MVITEVLYPKHVAINSPADLQNVLAGMKAGDYISLNAMSPAATAAPQSEVINIRLGQ